MMKITTKIIGRPSDAENQSVGLWRPPFQVNIDVQPPSPYCLLLWALPPIYDPFSDSMVVTFVWGDDIVQETATALAKAAAEVGK
jgi:hypothetical protein